MLDSLPEAAHGIHSLRATDYRNARERLRPEARLIMIDAALAERERLLHDAIERAHEKWYDGGCHETGCGCVTVYIQREVLPLLAACANEALERAAQLCESARSEQAHYAL